MSFSRGIGILTESQISLAGWVNLAELLFVSLSQGGSFLLDLWLLPCTSGPQSLSYGKALISILLNKHGLYVTIGWNRICCHIDTRPVLFMEDHVYHPELLDWQDLLHCFENRALTVHVEDAFFSKALVSRGMTDPGILTYLLAKHVSSNIWDARHACFRFFGTFAILAFQTRDAQPYPFLCLLQFPKGPSFSGPYAPCSALCFCSKELYLLGYLLRSSYSSVFWDFLSHPFRDLTSSHMHF